MSKPIQDAYIVAAVRTPVGKVRGIFRNTRPDDLLAHVLRGIVKQCPGLDPQLIGDVIVGCAMPEGEQGMKYVKADLDRWLDNFPRHNQVALGFKQTAEAAAKAKRDSDD